MLGEKEWLYNLLISHHVTHQVTVTLCMKMVNESYEYAAFQSKSLNAPLHLRFLTKLQYFLANY